MIRNPFVSARLIKSKESLYKFLTVTIFFFSWMLFSGSHPIDNTVTVLLLDSNGSQLTTGSLRYYQGGWNDISPNTDGSFTVITSASSLSYEMTYEHGSLVKSSIPVTQDTIIFQTVNVGVTLKNSLGELIDEGTVQYYSGGWHDFGITGGGVANKELLPRNYTFQMEYEHGSINISQDIGTNSIVEFHTEQVNVELRSSSGNLIDEGVVKYYSGGWHNLGVTIGGIASKELLPKEYTFQMTYEHGSNNKDQNISINNTVQFHTVEAKVELRNSLNELIDEGEVQYYSGGWHGFGDTSGGEVTKELLPRNYTFRMTYEYGATQKTQDIGSDNIVAFQTVRANVELRNSLEDLIDEGVVQYYSGGWHDLGITSGGIASKELLPRNYTFRMTYEHGSIQQAQNINANPVVSFATVNVIVQLQNLNGDLIDTGIVEYYSGGWHSLGTTTNGEVSKELLPRNYTFRMVYSGDSEKKAQNVASNALVLFQFEGEASNEPPALTIDTPADSIIVNQGTIFVSGSVDNPASTTVTVNSQLINVDPNGVFSTNVTLSEGPNSIQVTAENQSGQQTEIIRFITLDTISPDLTIISPLDSSFSNQEQVTIYGVASEIVTTLVIGGDTTSINPDNTFSVPVSIVEGMNSISFFALDPAGNSVEDTLTITGDFGTPELSTEIALGDPDVPGTIFMSTDDTVYVDQTQVYIVGSVYDLTNVVVTINDDTVITEENGELAGFDLFVDLAEGINVFDLIVTDQAGNNTSEQILVATPEPYKPTIMVSYPPANYQTDSSTVQIYGTVTDTSSTVTLTINNELVATSPEGAFTFSSGLFPGNNYFNIRAVNSYGQESFVSRKVFRNYVTEIPPNPEEVAPPIDSTIVTTIFNSTEFLYKGDSLIQYGVEEATIESRRVSVIRGKVLDTSGNPLSGALITITDHPEFGYTFSREDGMYDMAVNGGGHLELKFEKNDYLNVQRQVDVPWGDYIVVDSLYMHQFDPVVTTIDFSDSVEVAQGSIVNDEDGSRQATLLFKKGTGATMRLPDGTVQSLSTLNVRATEYTVGAQGFASMPSILPPSSGYTYCVDLTVDEAIQAGATSVEFDQPVAFYVENFIGFPTGSIVPSGYYDREESKWIASENGKVIEIIGINGNLADIDITGDGIADPIDSLLVLGIDNNEREKLATIYSAGQSLWRVEIDHFTPWDHNWPIGPPEDAVPPEVDQKRDRNKISENDKSGKECGSVISVENQTLGEAVGITGAPCGLHYNSGNLVGIGSDYVIPVNLTDSSTLASSLIRITLKINVAGRTFTKTFNPEPNLVYNFKWDGKDAYGRAVNGAQFVTIRLGYVYQNAFYARPSEFERSFSELGTQPAEFVLTRQNITYYQSWTTEIGRVIPYDFGGWTLGINHQYDVTKRLLYEGNGTIRKAETSDDIIRIALAANDIDAIPENFAVGPDGSIYSSFFGNDSYKIVRKKKEGGIETYVEFPYGQPVTAIIKGEDGSVGSFSLDFLFTKDIEISATGELYAIDFYDRIFRISESGEVELIAGIGEAGYSGDGGPAISARFGYVLDIAIAPDGTIYVADTGNFVIRKIGTNGIITTYAGNGAYGVFFNNGESALETSFSWIYGITLGPDGSLYVVNSSTGNGDRIRKITPDGIVNTVAGSDWNVFSDPVTTNRGDGGPATSAILLNPSDIAVGPDGSLYIAENNAHHIRKVTPDGTIFRLVGLFGENPYGYSDPGTLDEGGFNFNNGAAPATRLSFPNRIEIGPEGGIYFSEWDASGFYTSTRGNPDIRMIESGSDYFSASENIIPSGDGSELYVFDVTGRHMRTEDAITRNVIFDFSYNENGLLSEIEDIDGLTTTIERSASGTPTALIAPFGQRTELEIGENGYFSSIQNPEGETISFAYTENGLLTGVTDSKGNVSLYQYDEDGRFIRADYPNGGFTELVREEAEEGFQVSVKKAGGSAEKFTVERLVDGTATYINTDANGLETVKTYGNDGSVTITTPDGMTAVSKLKPDPRFGMQAPLVDTLELSTPSGLMSLSRQTRTISQYTGVEVTGLTDSLITNGKTTVSVYDGNLDRFTTTSPAGRQAFSFVDSLGRVTQSSVPGIAPINYSYNNDGFLTEIEQGGRSTTFIYNNQGFLESTTDPLGRVETVVYDSVGRVLSQNLSNGEQTLYEYDDNGNLISITPPGRPTHTFEYTNVDLTDSYAPPSVPDSAGGITYIYNLDKQLVRTIFEDSSTIDIVPDTTDCGCSKPRPAEIVFDRGIISFDYDSATGQLSSVVSPDLVMHSFQYDGTLVTQIAMQGAIQGVVGYTYNNDFQVTSQSINGANLINFAYDDDGLVTQAGALSLNYDPLNGLLNSSSLGNIYDSYTYNSFGEITGTTTSYNSSSLFDRTYGLDSLGRIVRIEETIEGETTLYDYTYNEVGYLTGVKEDGVLTAEYEYDANGNRTLHFTPTDTITAVYDDQDRLLAYGATLYSYNTRGDLYQKVEGADTTAYDYDNLGNLRSVILPDGRLIEYLIDGQNRRVGKKVNGTVTKRWLYSDGLLPIAELNGSGNIEMQYGPGYIIKNDTTYGIITDQLGSVRMIINAQTGEVVQRLDYDAWGNITYLQNQDQFTDFTFANGLYDLDTGLIRFGVRDYDTETGRWTAKDPILFDGGASNLYEYVFNDPINNIDPLGLSCNSNVLDYFQTGLDIVGLIPGVGEFADGANALIYLARGDYLNAGLSATAMVPFLGWGSTGAKLGTKAAKGIPKYLYHYTSREAAQSISQNGLRVGRDGFSYLTNTGSLSPIQAQIELALPANRALSNSVLRINTSELTPTEIRRVQGNLSGLGAGGGTEFLFNQTIPSNLIKIIR